MSVTDRIFLNVEVKIIYVYFFSFLICITFQKTAYTNFHVEKSLCKVFFFLFSYPSYYVWGTLVIVQIFDFRFLMVLDIWGNKEFEKSQTWNCAYYDVNFFVRFTVQTIIKERRPPSQSRKEQNRNTQENVKNVSFEE